MGDGLVDLVGRICWRFRGLRNERDFDRPRGKKTLSPSNFWLVIEVKERLYSGQA